MNIKRGGLPIKLKFNEKVQFSGYARRRDMTSAACGRAALIEPIVPQTVHSIWRNRKEGEGDYESNETGCSANRRGAKTLDQLKDVE